MHSEEVPVVDKGFPTTMIRLLIVALLALGLALAAACGGGDDDDSGDDGGEPTGAETTAPPDETTPGGGPGDEVTFTVDKEFWHSGFHVTVNEGVSFSVEETLSQDVTYLVEIGASFENLGPDQTFFSAPIALVADGNSFASSFNSDLPNVPSGLSSDGLVSFVVDEGFDYNSAQLVIGAADENQAQVPLGSSGELIGLAPSEPPITGAITLELVDLTVTSAELRVDRPSSYTEIESGKLALTLNFDATSRKSGNWQLFANNFALVLPDGSGVAADGADLASLPGADAGTTTSDLYVRFLVDDPPAGEYTLRFTPADYWFTGDPVEGTLTFELN
jgi:hypothetical protein